MTETFPACRQPDDPAGAEDTIWAHDAPAAARKTVLNVGCGYPLRQRLHRHFHGAEWREIRLDIDPAVRPDSMCSITDMSPVMSQSVDAVWSSHNLEHLHRHEVPSALAEISFLSNSQEVRLIRGTGYRQRIAEALFEAIREYQVSLKTDAKDAQE